MVHFLVTESSPPTCRVPNSFVGYEIFYPVGSLHNELQDRLPSASQATWRRQRRQMAIFVGWIWWISSYSFYVYVVLYNFYPSFSKLSRFLLFPCKLSASKLDGFWGQPLGIFLIRYGAFDVKKKIYIFCSSFCLLMMINANLWFRSNTNLCCIFMY